ncbi:hypothetical protein [Caballeronia zhejiangensis]|uniref:hypothetical protein n=1 Tax=Caballeronia zhejiangensis TaxID=871203 RepID=UPI001ABA868B|nr:hypothetical protein [Caballeronia zhejiangensis]
MLQTVKPRARQQCGLWVVHGAGMQVFGPTLAEALRLWYSCDLLGRALPRPRK